MSRFALTLVPVRIPAGVEEDGRFSKKASIYLIQ